MNYGEALSNEYTEQFKNRMSPSIWKKVSSVFPSLPKDPSPQKELIHATTALISHLSELIILLDNTLNMKESLILYLHSNEKALQSRNKMLEDRVLSLETELNRTARIRLMGDS
jgi:hypothetical protein